MNFKDKYFFLSNMYPCTITIDGIVYKCSETAYQAQKAVFAKDKLKISQMNGYEAKQYGKQIDLVENWDTNKVKIMTKVVYEKFTQNPYLANLLLNTGNEKIVEDNTWGDQYWGMYNGRGKNLLGEILMAVRFKLRFVDGDILSPHNITTVIVHQVNCQGVMGAGLAKQIRNKYPIVYEKYRQYTPNNDLLGKIQLIKVEEGLYICNLFGQCYYGTDKQYTDYQAVQLGLQKLSSKVAPNVEVRIPYKMGCGLGGGDWNVICDILKSSGLNYKIYKKEELK